MHEGRDCGGGRSDHHDASSSSSTPDELHIHTLGLYVVVMFVLSSVAFCARACITRGARHRELARKERWVTDLIAAVSVAALVLSWYGISVTFTLFNKWVLRLWRGGEVITRWGAGRRYSCTSDAQSASTTQQRRRSRPES